jgi:hypothetical protein
MKSSVLLRTELKNEEEYNKLVGSIHDLLLGHSGVISKDLFREEGPYTDPKVSSYVLCYFGLGNTIIDYSSHRRTDERFEKGDIWIRVIGKKPRSTAEFISQHFGYWFERERKSWQETVFNYARMRERLKLIYTPKELEEILDELEADKVKPENLFFSPLFFDFFKRELIKNLKDILIEDMLDKAIGEFDKALEE